MKPQLKGVVWERDQDELRLVYDRHVHFMITDPTGAIEALLVLLRAGGRSLAELAVEMRANGHDVSQREIQDALTMLDESGLVEDRSTIDLYGVDEKERFFSNLAFFESFSTLSRTREDFQNSLRSSHVLVLGTGGLNSNTIPSLCGLGIGRLTLLDSDHVDRKNFARQFLYRQEQIGSRKVSSAVSWVEKFDPSIKVAGLDTRIESQQQIQDLLQEYEPDVVMSGVDSPRGIDNWVNRACLAARIPYVRGGMWVSHGVVWSVDPGVSACRECGDNEGDNDDIRKASALFSMKDRVNRGIGPVAALLGSLCAFEVMRYVTRFEEPAYAGSPVIIDFANGCRTETALTPKDPQCSSCELAQ